MGGVWGVHVKGFLAVMQPADHDRWIKVKQLTISRVKLGLKYELRSWIVQSRSSGYDLLTVWFREITDYSESRSPCISVLSLILWYDTKDQRKKWICDMHVL